MNRHMWLFSIAPVSNALLRPLESVYPIPKDPKGDVIVLLCGGARSCLYQRVVDTPVTVGAALAVRGDRRQDDPGVDTA